EADGARAAGEGPGGRVVPDRLRGGWRLGSHLGTTQTMRGEGTVEKLRRFIEALGNAARGPGRGYLTGAATALIEGWRTMSVDLDLKLDPEPPGVFEAIARLKDEQDISVELAAPDDFVPALPGWQDRSRFVATHGPVSFYEYDPYGQVLAKIARGH